MHETSRSDRGAALVRSDAATVAAVGVLAATLAAVAHETLGHGLGCVAVGGRITLLTSIYFRCHGATGLTDAAGPLGNLALGSLALLLLRRRDYGPATRLVLVMVAAIDLFWFAGQLVYDSLRSKDDWAFLAHQGWGPGWRMAAAATGVAVYLAAGRLLRPAAAQLGASSIRLAYALAAASAVLAGLMWEPAPFAGALEGGLAVGLAPLALLALGARADEEALTVPRSTIWIIAAGLVFLPFLVVQARRVGELAALGLPR